MNFEIGEIPRGWKRGDALQVLQASKHAPRGALINVQYRLDRTVDPTEIGAVEFTLDMAAKVQAWLDWWREPVATVRGRGAPE